LFAFLLYAFVFVLCCFCLSFLLLFFFCVSLCTNSYYHIEDIFVLLLYVIFPIFLIYFFVFCFVSVFLCFLFMLFLCLFLVFSVLFLCFLYDIMYVLFVFFLGHVFVLLLVCFVLWCVPFNVFLCFSFSSLKHKMIFSDLAYTVFVFALTSSGFSCYRFCFRFVSVFCF